jgi:hypothetical protein
MPNRTNYCGILFSLLLYFTLIIAIYFIKTSCSCSSNNKMTTITTKTATKQVTETTEIQHTQNLQQLNKNQQHSSKTLNTKQRNKNTETSTPNTSQPWRSSRHILFGERPPSGASCKRRCLPERPLAFSPRLSTSASSRGRSRGDSGALSARTAVGQARQHQTCTVHMRNKKTTKKQKGDEINRYTTDTTSLASPSDFFPPSKGFLSVRIQCRCEVL